MKIDNRIFIVPAMPFAGLFLARAVWWMAGAAWSNPDMAASFCLIFGMLGGAVLVFALNECRISLGTTTIGRAKNVGDAENQRDV
jgi:hypothetical protein